MLSGRDIRVHIDLTQIEEAIGNIYPWIGGHISFLYALAHFLNSDGTKRRVQVFLHQE